MPDQKDTRLRKWLLPVQLALYPFILVLSCVYLMVEYKRQCKTWFKFWLYLVPMLALVFILPVEIVWAVYAIVDVVLLILRPIVDNLRFSFFSSHAPSSHVVIFAADTSASAVWWAVVVLGVHVPGAKASSSIYDHIPLYSEARRARGGWEHMARWTEALWGKPVEWQKAKEETETRKEVEAL